MTVAGEFTSWPLLCRQGLREARTTIDHRALVGTLKSRAAGHHIHRDLARRGRAAWADQQILEHLQSVAGAHLRRDGDTVRLKEAATEAGVLHWRDLSLSLPPALLSVALGPFDARPVHAVQVLEPAMAPHGALAHLHQHAGACASFELTWSHLAGTLDVGELRKSVPEGFGAGEWRLLLSAALLARRWLASRWMGVPLRWVGADPDWLRFLQAPATWQTYAPMKAWDWARRATRPADLTKCLDVACVDDAWHLDPLWTGGGAWAEGRFLQAGFQRFGSRQELDQEGVREHRVFLQILRIKTHLFRHLLPDARYLGLGPFTDVYKRMGPYRGQLEAHGLELGARRDAIDLRAVEVRTAPPRSAQELLDLVSVPADDSASTGDEELEWGWTFHFLRDVDRYRPKDALPNAWLIRSLRRTQVEVGRLRRMFEMFPQLLSVFRGIDTASDELEGPMWVMAPAIHTLRELSEDIAARHDIGRSMRVTLHAGEDFSHPLTGLRHVHELVLWQLVRSQDRIGHAIALGVDARSYEGEVAAQPRYERFLDLAWLLSVREVRHVWQRELADLAAQMGMASGRPLHELVDIHRKLGEKEAMAGNWAVGLAPTGDTALDDFLRAMVRPAAHEVVTQVIEEGEVAVVEKLQRTVASALADLHVAIELNPTSNLLIAGLDAPLSQPLFARLSRELGLKVTLSADDPLLLSTQLDDEYAYAHAGLTRAGMSPAEATAWLEEAAEASMRARFTLAESASLVEEEAPLYPTRRWRRLRRG